MSVLWLTCGGNHVLGAVCAIWPCLAVLGCASLPLDRSVPLGKPTDAPPIYEVPVRGYLVDVELVAGCSHTGELLAADQKRLWLEAGDSDDATLRTLEVPLGSIDSVRIEVHESDSATIGGWMAIGAVSTVTHGFFLILTLPAWALTGGLASGLEAGNNDAEASSADEQGFLYQYARFPQGLPEAFRDDAIDGRCVEGRGL
jgi:hypothetical protein